MVKHYIKHITHQVVTPGCHVVSLVTCCSWDIARRRY